MCDKSSTCQRCVSAQLRAASLLINLGLQPSPVTGATVFSETEAAPGIPIKLGQCGAPLRGCGNAPARDADQSSSG
jgi:hypothetical protein